MRLMSELVNTILSIVECQVKLSHGSDLCLSDATRSYTATNISKFIQ